MTAQTASARPFTVDIVDINHELHETLNRSLSRMIPEGIRIRTHVTQGDFRSAVRPDDLPEILVLSLRQHDKPVSDFVAALKREGWEGKAFLCTGAARGSVDDRTLVAVDDVYYKPDGIKPLARAICAAYDLR